MESIEVGSSYYLFQQMSDLDDDLERKRRVMDSIDRINDAQQDDSPEVAVEAAASIIVECLVDEDHLDPDDIKDVLTHKQMRDILRVILEDADFTIRP